MDNGKEVKLKAGVQCFCKVLTGSVSSAPYPEAYTLGLCSLRLAAGAFRSVCISFILPLMPSQTNLPVLRCESGRILSHS